MSAFFVIVGVVGVIWLGLSITLVFALAAAAGRECPKPWSKAASDAATASVEQTSPIPADQAAPRQAWAFWRRRRLRPT